MIEKTHWTGASIHMHLIAYNTNRGWYCLFQNFDNSHSHFTMRRFAKYRTVYKRISQQRQQRIIMVIISKKIAHFGGRK